MGSELDLESVQRSYTAPDRTGIRIYYSPPAVRRNQEGKELQQDQNGSSSLGLSGSDVGMAAVETLEVQQPPSSFSSSYEQWLSSLSKQHRELLESRSGCITGSIPSVVNNGFGGSANSLVDGMTPSSAFHSLEIGEISANLSDDMKEMTNCVRQAIRSSSLERKSTKEPGSQVDFLINSKTDFMTLHYIFSFSKHSPSLLFLRLGGRHVHQGHADCFTVRQHWASNRQPSRQQGGWATLQSLVSSPFSNNHLISSVGPNPADINIAG